MHSLGPTIGLRIEEVRTRFEQAWRTASPPSIDEYLTGWTGDIERQRFENHFNTHAEPAKQAEAQP